MKTKGIILIVLGILGCLFVYAFDTLVGKPVNDITGPKSISALALCGLLILIGIRLVLKTTKK